MNFGTPALVVPPSLSAIAHRATAEGGVGPPEGGTTNTRPRTFAFSFLLFALGLFLPAAAGGDAVTGPATNWVLPLFTDRDGYRSMTLRGGTMKPIPDQRVALKELNITIFSGDAAARVESILLSPEAIFFPKENRISGEKGVRVIRDDLEATSTTWIYDHARKRVTLQGNVRIVLNAEMKDLLQ